MGGAFGVGVVFGALLLMCVSRLCARRDGGKGAAGAHGNGGGCCQAFRRPCSAGNAAAGAPRGESQMLGREAAAVVTSRGEALREVMGLGQQQYSQ